MGREGKFSFSESCLLFCFLFVCVFVCLFVLRKNHNRQNCPLEEVMYQKKEKKKGRISKKRCQLIVSLNRAVYDYCLSLVIQEWTELLS